MNSRWSSPGGRALRACLLVLAAISGCASAESRRAARREKTPPDQAEAELLGREVAEIVDRVMSYKTAHQGRLPISLRQAGLDSLAPLFVRRLGRKGSDPLVTIVFRRTERRALVSCEATNSVLEDMLLRAGAFDVSCRLVDGSMRGFTVPGPPPPTPPKS